MKKKVTIVLLLFLLGIVVWEMAEKQTESKEVDTSADVILERIEPSGERSLFNEVEDWNVYVCETDENSTHTLSHGYETTDWNEVKAFLEQSEPYLRYPSFIPEGYEFESAILHYYLTEEDWKILKPEEALETSTGSIQYKYLLPESVLEKLRGYDLIYQNSDGQILEVTASYESTIYMNVTVQKLENIESEFFERVSVGMGEDDYYYGEFGRKAEPIYECSPEGEVTEWDAMVYTVRMSEVENEQVEQMVIAVGESIQ